MSDRHSVLVGTNRQVAEAFFAAYQRHDADAMCRLLHPQMTFQDRAFENLAREDTALMWRWFCTVNFGRRREPVRVAGFEITGSGADTVDVRYRVQYELFRDRQAASTPGAAPQRRVDYAIDSHLVFRDGLIYRQTDKPAIASMRFAYMIAGLKGCLGVLLGKFDGAVRAQARQGLSEFRQSAMNGDREFARPGN